MRKLILAVTGILGLAVLASAQTPTSISMLYPTTNQWVYGVTPFELQVTAQDGTTPNGLMNYSVDGGSTVGLGPVDQNGMLTSSISPMDVGNHTVTFNFMGNSPYSGSSLSESVTVSPNQLNITISLNQTSYTYGAGGPTVNVTITGGAHYGVLTLYADGTTLESLSPLTQDSAVFGPQSVPPGGTHQLYAEFTPLNNSNTLTSDSNEIQITVAQATPNMVVSGSPNPAQEGTNPTVTAQMTEPGNWQASLPTGTIDFSEGSTDYGTVAMNRIYSYAQIVLSNLSVGSHTITATYSGDTNFTPTAMSFVETIQPVQIQTTTTLTTDLGQYAFNQPVQATIAVDSGGYGAPTGSVAVDDGSTPIGSGTLVNGRATLTLGNFTLGAHRLVAIYQPAGNFAQSASMGTTFEVVQATTSLQINGPNSTPYGQVATFNVTVVGQFGGTATGQISASDGTNNYGPFTLSGGAAVCLITPPSSGSMNLTFTYSGDGNYLTSNAADSVSVIPAIAQVTLGNLNQTYSASQESASVTTNPSVGVAVTYNGSSTAPTAAGSYNVLAAVTDPNYTGSATGTLVISPAPLSVQADNAMKYLNLANPTFMGSLSGVLGSDGILATYATSAATTSPVGSYPITATLHDPNMRLSNYAVSNVAGVLRIVYYGTGQFGGALKTGTVSWSVRKTLTVQFTVLDGKKQAVKTNGTISDMRIISIDGTPTNLSGELPGSKGWTLGGSNWQYQLNLSSLAIGHTYVFEIFLDDSYTTKSFTVTTTK